MKNKISILTILVIVYILLKHFIPYWNFLVYPINILVTFLHEFWHAFFTLITKFSWILPSSIWMIIWLIIIIIITILNLKLIFKK